MHADGLLLTEELQSAWFKGLVYYYAAGGGGGGPGGHGGGGLGFLGLGGSR